MIHVPCPFDDWLPEKGDAETFPSGKWSIYFRANAKTLWVPVRWVVWKDVPVNIAGSLVNQTHFLVQVARTPAEHLIIDSEGAALRVAHAWFPRLRVYYPLCGLQVAGSHTISGGLAP